MIPGVTGVEKVHHGKSEMQCYVEYEMSSIDVYITKEKRGVNYTEMLFDDFRTR